MLKYILLHNLLNDVSLLKKLYNISQTYVDTSVGGKDSPKTHTEYHYLFATFSKVNCCALIIWYLQNKSCTKDLILTMNLGAMYL